MFAQIFLARQTITFLACAALISLVVWRVYSAGENNARQKQINSDQKAERIADDIRRSYGGADIDRLLDNDAFLRR